MDSFYKLRKMYTYTPETRDYWKLWDKNDYIFDDCDGFSLNLIYRHFGEFWKPIFKGYAKVYHCTYYGEGHMVCMIGDKYFDNISTKPMDILPSGYKNIKQYKPISILLSMYIFKSYWMSRLRKFIGR